MSAVVSNTPEMWVSASVRTDVGMRRTGNEDNLQVVDLTRQRLGLSHREDVLSPDVAHHQLGSFGTLLIVSDGMGGAAAGELASEMAVEIIAREMLRQVSAGIPSRDAMRIAADSANAAIWDRSQSDSAIRGLGATLTALHITGQEATVSQVGDSRAYLIRNGTIRQLTEDQSWANAAKKAGMQVANVPNNVILQALGTQRVVNTDITTEPLQVGDIFLLCSDGLSNKVEEQELLAHVMAAESLDDAAEALVKLANDRGGEDNITIVIAKLVGSGSGSEDSMRSTQLLTSATTAEETLRISGGRATTELQSVQTLSGLGTTKSLEVRPANPDALATSSKQPLSVPVSPPSPVAETSSGARSGWLTGGRLFVLLALIAVAGIVLAGVASMVWVLQLRAEKQRTAGIEPTIGGRPALEPSPVTPQPTKPPAEAGYDSGGIGRADGALLEDVEKKLNSVEQRVKEVERRASQSPGYANERQNCQEKYRRLATLREVLNRHRGKQVRDGDPSVSDIDKEAQTILEWIDTLPLPLREMKAPGNKRRQPPESHPGDELQRVVEQGLDQLMNNAVRSVRHP
ncbi:serine/threonine-protein phosphatase [Chloracidobacterium validum]|uniref:Serine/threonine-protein phosphatase n=1 Tax=Chloracidobacterium validum TaxID=2821543 RepID=A0ABX8B776_9BACT|nr:protein phosphatase 2C domain-containing protein [Chloracidobacterium validum]QUW01911.1 serine/threonine-protein phosphatase [Chloracidobacterium validum]